MANKIILGVLGGIALIAIVLGFTVVGTYNGLVGLDQAAEAQWGQVENTYQRRADLVPNLVATVKGSANFEQQTLTAVTEARAKDGLSSALSRLMVVAERYPELKATAGFRDLQAQLEGTENRITVERMRFNEAAQAFNTRRESFPTIVIAGFFGERFRVKPYFKAQTGAEKPPEVKF